MESYQTAGLITTTIGILAGLVFTIFIPPLGLLVLGANIVMLILISKQGMNIKILGIILIVVGIFSNWLLLIPGVMAILHYRKHRLKQQGLSSGW